MLTLLRYKYHFVYKYQWSFSLLAVIITLYNIFIKTNIFIGGQMSQQLNNRTPWLDMARSFAIFFVVLCHATERIYRDPNSLSNISMVFRIFCFTIGRLGVPIFLFLTGYLLLSREYKTGLDCSNFYKKKLFPLLITVEIWIVLYNIFLPLYHNIPFNFTSMLKQMIFIEKTPIAHMWYMPMILGLYLVLPLLSRAIKDLSLYSLAYPLLVSVLLFLILPNINVLLDILKIDAIEGVRIDFSFLGGQYGIYLISGYYLGKGALRKIPNITLYMVCGIFFLFTCWFQFFAYRNGYAFNVWYNFIGIFIASVCLFEIISRINLKNKMIVRALNKVSVFSLGVYFLHMPVQLILQKILYLDVFNCSIRVIVLFGLSSIISCLIVQMTNRFTYINKILYLTK